MLLVLEKSVRVKYSTSHRAEHTRYSVQLWIVRVPFGHLTLVVCHFHEIAENATNNLKEK